MLCAGASCFGSWEKKKRVATKLDGFAENPGCWAECVCTSACVCYNVLLSHFDVAKKAFGRQLRTGVKVLVCVCERAFLSALVCLSSL